MIAYHTDIPWPGRGFSLQQGGIFFFFFLIWPGWPSTVNEEDSDAIKKYEEWNKKTAETNEITVEELEILEEFYWKY